MIRYAMKALRAWKNRHDRKPLLLEGARQVGKTWLMKEFGRTEFPDFLYLNFDEDPALCRIFEPDLKTDRLIRALEVAGDKRIIPGETLLVLDEIQEAPRALASLKYFCENAPRYPVVCAGSLLGIALHNGTSFPVGKIESLKISPMSFTEFLIATGRERCAELILGRDYAMLETFRETYANALRQYCFVGGMPEAVSAFAKDEDYRRVRAVQQDILANYQQDFSKHAPESIVPRIRMVFSSVPSQLAKENKKFVYGLVREGARARDFEIAIMWLCDCGILTKVSRVNSGAVPLSAYEDPRAFKLYLLDVGLLTCMAQLSPKVLLDGDRMFVEFKGALSEQYVLQQITASSDMGVFYYSNDRGSAEVDFVLNTGMGSVPLEVRAEKNLRAKSLKTYREKFQPDIAVRASMAAYAEDGGLLNVPLYAAENIPEEIFARV